MPAKFGNIAKVSVNRASEETTATTEQQQTLFDLYDTAPTDTNLNFTEFQSLLASAAYTPTIPSVEIHLLSYDNNKNLVVPPVLLQNNLRNYLNEFRIISDEFATYSGKVVNFGVAF